MVCVSLLRIRIGALLFTTALVAGLATGVAAQTHNSEVFAAYSIHRASVFNLTIHPAPIWQNGVSLGYARKLTEHFAVLLDVSGHFHRGDLTDTLPGRAGLVFRTKRDQYYVLGGLEYRLVARGAFSPFVRGLAGASLFRGYAESRAGGNIFTFDDAASAAIAIGGGIDARITSRMGIRLVVIEYTPTFFGSERQNNMRSSLGVLYRW